MRLHLILVVTLLVAACATVERETPALPEDFSLPSPAYARATVLSGALDSPAGEITAVGQSSNCPDEFWAERPPVLLDTTQANNLTALCFEHFSVLHSALRRGPIWSAYHLTKEMSEEGDAFKGKRPGYHPEKALPKEAQSKASDFNDNAYDVGHMTPNNDMPDKASQWESFSLANMSPQYFTLNRISWRAVEAAVHHRAKIAGQLYIVTGAIFPADPELMNGRVAIPSAFFKAVYDTSNGRAIAFLFDNKANAACQLLSLGALEVRAKMRPFPTLPEPARQEPGAWDVPDICDTH